MMGLVYPMHARAQHLFGGQADCGLHLSQCLEFPEKEEAELCQESKGVLPAATASTHRGSEGQWLLQELCAPAATSEQ